MERRFDELTAQMADPAVISDSDAYRKVTKAQSELSETVSKYREYKHVKHNLDEGRQNRTPSRAFRFHIRTGTLPPC